MIVKSCFGCPFRCGQSCKLYEENRARSVFRPDVRLPVAIVSRPMTPPAWCPLRATEGHPRLLGVTIALASDVGEPEEIAQVEDLATRLRMRRVRSESCD